MIISPGRLVVRRAVGYAGALGVIWLIVAFARPSTTFHLAPLLVAGTLPIVLSSGEPAPGLGRLAGGAGIGAALGLTFTSILTVADRLQGPSLLPAGGAVTESVVFALIGAVGGLLVSLIRPGGRRRAEASGL